MKEMRAVAQALESNRRTLALLDKKLLEMEGMHPEVMLDMDDEDRVPFMYAAIGSDGARGIPLPLSVTIANEDNPSFGYIRTDPDSAFVLHDVQIGVTGRVINQQGVTRTRELNAGLGIRLYDESSSRWISLTQRDNTPQRSAVVPAELFSPFNYFNEGGTQLPVEAVFPRSAVVRVEVYVYGTNVTGRPPGAPANRAEVVFNGYKVFGG